MAALPDAKHVVFVALGSRGDAQPLAVLASAVAERGLRVSFATHAELKGHLQHSREASPLSARVSWRPLATPCFVRPTSADEAHTPDILDLQGRRRAEWVEAVAAARDADALVCNLFAMPPVYHLSERLEVPWMCCSPCLVPYSMPPGFEQGFAETMPELFAFLREQDTELAVPSEPPAFSWKTVCSWLWPVFTESHALLREELLGLAPVPGYAEEVGTDRDQFDAKTLRLGKFLLGVPPALLSAADPGRALPTDAKICGHWSPSLDVSASQRCSREYQELSAFLQNCEEQVQKGILKGRPFYVGFGSMGAEGLVPEVDKMIKILLDTGKWMGRPLVLMAPSSATFCKQELLEESIFWCQHAVPHGWLLPRCAVAIHHGGIGTVLAALRAQVPQLVLPLAYDQPFWASCVKDLNVGDSADLDHLSVVVLARKLQRLLRDEVRVNVRRVGEEVEMQAGTETAVKEIMAMAATAPLRCAQSGACLRPARPIHAFLEEDPDAALDVLGRSAGEVQFIYREILRERCYGDLNKLPADSIVVDGGLNLGLFSLILARQWKGPGTLTVLAFEPAKETFDLALANLRRNGVFVINHGQSLPSNSSGSTSGVTAGTAVVHCFQLALSDRDGRDQLCYFPYLTSSSTLARHRPAKDEAKSNGCFDRRLVDIFFADEKQEPIFTARLSSALTSVETAFPTLKDQPISLIKLDIEGAEEEALAGLEADTWPRVQRLAMEVHGGAALRRLQTTLAPRAAALWVESQVQIPDHYMLYALAEQTAGQDPKLEPFDMLRAAAEKCSVPHHHRNFGRCDSGAWISSQLSL